MTCVFRCGSVCECHLSNLSVPSSFYMSRKLLFLSFNARLIERHHVKGQFRKWTSDLKHIHNWNIKTIVNDKGTSTWRVFFFFFVLVKNLSRFIHVFYLCLCHAFYLIICHCHVSCFMSCDSWSLMCSFHVVP